jgi:hypothetical protein
LAEPVLILGAPPTAARHTRYCCAVGLMGGK